MANLAVILVNCLVMSDATTSDCHIEAAKGFHGDQAQALQHLKAFPLRMTGAAPGERLQISLVADRLLARAATPQPDVEPGPTDFRAWKVGAGPVGAYFPQRAYNSGQSGVTSTRCRITGDGVLDECWVRSATPDGYGFGAAAVRLLTGCPVSPSAPEAPRPISDLYDVTISWRAPG